MRVLVAEDDKSLAERLCAVLNEAGFTAEHSGDGIDAEFRGATEPFAAAVLDLGLPGMDGLSVLRRWREQGLGFPVLILTARDRFHDKLAGFNAGADDYLTKPFQLEEVVLRVRALIRRSAGHAHPVLRCGALSLDSHSGRFALDDAPLSLTAQEAKILQFFLHNQARIISRSALGEHVYEGGFDPESNVIDVLLGRIRRKIGEGLWHTHRGQGFRLEAQL